MRRPILLATVAACAALPGCQLDFSERVTGTAIGTAGGALAGGLLGSAVGSTATGAILGGIAGGAAGYIIGDWMADKRERQAAQASARDHASYAQAPSPAYDGGTPEPAGYAGPVGAPGAIAASGPGTTSKARADMARREYEAGRRATDAGEALRHYQEASRLDPSRPEPHNARGLVLLYLERRPEARAAFQRALSVDGTYAPAQQNLQKMSGGA